MKKPDEISKAYFAQAFPKINITLKIGEKIGNLHTLQSRFCLVKESLYDSILIVKTPLQEELLPQTSITHGDIVSQEQSQPYKSQLQEHLQCCLYGNFDCKIEDNLIFKACVQLLQHLDFSAKPCAIHIIVDKKIPVGGGLGGGSVNAALTLLLLNELFDLRCDEKTLYDCAKTLGSDVAFFLMVYTQNSAHIAPYFYTTQTFSKDEVSKILTTFQTQKILNANFAESLKEKQQKECIHFLSANVFGTGEIVEPFYEELPHFIIHCNPIACNTGAVYNEFAKQRELAIKDSKQEIIDLKKDSLVLLKTYDMFMLNDLYKPACNLYGLESIANMLCKNYGNVYFSGSGSSFFSIKQNTKE